MDFARKQLEKYGWTDGKGLGKNENGISEAIKPKLKRSVAGIGHDAAADFNEHWWQQLYDKAAKNVQVEEKNGTTKKIKTKDNQFKITNSTYQLSKKSDSKEKEEYSDFFVRTAVMNGGSQVETVRESDSDEEMEKTDVIKMTDDELFAACEGRTAHKGARHGLTALGKLARIERQEQMLLAQHKYSGYSHVKKLKKDKKIASELDLRVVEDANLNSEGDCIQIKKRKKKRKRCFSNESVTATLAECVEPLPVEKDIEMAGSNDVSNSSKKSKKSKRKLNEQTDESDVPKKKKNHNIMETESCDTISEESVPKLKKCKKKKQCGDQY